MSKCIRSRSSSLTWEMLHVLLHRLWLLVEQVELFFNTWRSAQQLRGSHHLSPRDKRLSAREDKSKISSEAPWGDRPSQFGWCKEVFPRLKALTLVLNFGCTSASSNYCYKITMCLSGSLKTELVLLSEISVKLIILFLLKEKKNNKMLLVEWPVWQQ